MPAFANSQRTAEVDANTFSFAGISTNNWKNVYTELMKAFYDKIQESSVYSKPNRGEHKCL